MKKAEKQKSHLMIFNIGTRGFVTDVMFDIISSQKSMNNVFSLRSVCRETGGNNVFRSDRIFEKSLVRDVGILRKMRDTKNGSNTNDVSRSGGFDGPDGKLLVLNTGESSGRRF